MAEKEYIERDEISQYLKDCYEYYARKIKEAVYWDEAKAYRVLQVLAADMFEYFGHRAPAADVTEVVHGEWVQNPYCKRIFYCSECGRTVEDGSYNPNPSEHFPYCHCGAKMYKENLDG